MPPVSVVELRRTDDGVVVVGVVRFVLLPAGDVRAVALAEGGTHLSDLIARDGVPGAAGRRYPADGLAFLEALPRHYAGSRLWATAPFEMDLEAALTPPDPATLPPARPVPPPPPPRP